MFRLTPLRSACLVALGLALLVPGARAADDGISTSFSGYGTVAVAKTNDKTPGGFTTSQTQLKGATDQIDVGLESRLGLQGVVKFDPRFSVTAQVLAQRRGDKDFDLGTEWLYGQYTPVTGVDLRLGRVVMPNFLFSDSRNVGYASPWLTAPNGVYAPMFFSSLDGVQGSWRVNAGPATLTTQLSYGNTSADIHTVAGVLSLHAKDVIVAGFTLESGNWTARLSESRLTIPVALPVAPGVTLDHQIDDRFLSTGLQYDNGSALLIAEWEKRTENNVAGIGKPVAATTSWYVAAGWRFGDFTPLLRYVSTTDNGSLLGFPKTPNYGVSLRYDAFHNVALKAQIDRYDASNPSAFIHPEAAPGRKVNVISLGADFVF